MSGGDSFTRLELEVASILVRATDVRVEAAPFLARRIIEHIHEQNQ